jgi:transcriptional regulator with XRE-family HTH domain
MTPEQCRMARAALEWSQSDLANNAKVRQVTVSEYERGSDARRSTVEKLREALEAGGVIFFAAGDGVPAGGPGVRLR